MKDYVFVIDCSDSRNEYLLKSLIKDGYNVKVFSKGENYKDINGRLFIFVFAPSYIIDKETVKSMKNDSIVFCLKYDDTIKTLFAEKNITAYKLFDDEILAMKNAYLTAEGALAYIIENTDISIINMKVLVLGYGRVGKSVSKILNDNRSAVSVATDDEAEYAMASIYNDNVYKLCQLKDIVNSYSVIVNTIPCLILKGEILKEISEECFVLDLASYPGGIDYIEAQKLNIKTMHALGVPGKIAPKTSGEEIKKSILKKLFPEVQHSYGK
jgi:dipicolinate synthase subunit A